MAAQRLASWVSGTEGWQHEVFGVLLSKHLPNEAAAATSEDFSRTSTDRGIHIWEHQHLIAALDTLNTYQRDRQGRACFVLYTFRRSYRSDPRTRLVEVLKRWLRKHAAAAQVDESEVRCLSGLCSDLLNHRALFPARNKRSFVRTIADVYDHLLRQLQEVIEQDRTCARLAKQVISLSKNFLSDVVCYLLLAGTEFKQTDWLPSMEVVVLWRALPAGSRVPPKPDKQLQEKMKPVWKTHIGALMAALLSTPSAVQLFGGCSADQEQLGVATGPCDVETVPALIRKAKRDFDQGQFNRSGLAGAFRTSAEPRARLAVLDAARCASDLMFLLGEIFLQFHCIGQNLGDYGMIRAAPFLHPFLADLKVKVLELCEHLESLNGEVVERLVLSPSRRQKVKKPTPTLKMSQQASEAFQRAVGGKNSHAQCFLVAVDELRVQSRVERLPEVRTSLGGACSQLQVVLSSDEFIECIGDGHRDQFPRPTQLDGAAQAPQLLRNQASPSGEVFGELRNAASSLASTSSRPLAVADLDPLTPPRSPRPSPASQSPSAGGDDVVRWAGHGPLPPMLLQTELEADEASWDSLCNLCGISWRLPEPYNGICTSCDSPVVEVRSFGAAAASSSAGASATQHARFVGAFSAATVERYPAAETAGLQALVWRMTNACSGFTRHDRRLVRLSHGRLHIFQNGSVTSVKTDLNVLRDVVECHLITGQVMSLVIRRKPRVGFISMGGEGEGDEEPKHYFFEFPSEESASEFHCEIVRLLSARA